METYDVITTRRSIREFQDKKIPLELLKKFVNAGRLAPQAANRQPLEFVVVDAPDMLNDFFRYTKLANYLGWEPSASKKARAYIVILANTRIQKDRWMHMDAALAAENIALAAWDEGVGSCMIGAFNKNNINDLLNVPDHFETTLVIALGYPAHKSVAEDIKGDDVDYWRDEDGTFHVPKRLLEKVIHHNKF